MSDVERSARSQLASDYDHILSDSYRTRWAGTNPGNQAILAERNAVLTVLTTDVLPRRPLRVLDVGCGSLSILPDSMDVGVCIGIDLLFNRLAGLRVSGMVTPVANADGARLPFPSDTFDVAVLSTMMSSVLDGDLRRAVAAEVSRTLKPGGAVLWYDMRMPNPRNKATRSVGRAELRSLFPTFTGEIRSLTVIPVLARRLGLMTSRLYPLLARFPPCRSHLAACLAKPS